MRLAFDVESNGFLDDATRIWCLVTQDLDTGLVSKFGPDQVEEGLKLLMSADTVMGHNIIPYDIPLIQKLYPWFTVEWTRVVDTLILSRLLFTNLSDTDMGRPLVCAANMIGRHSLEAWGLRFGVPKLEHEDWTQFSPEMLARCTVDVAITVRLWNACEKKGIPARASELEHKVAVIVARQHRRGFAFDVVKAGELASTLMQRMTVLERELQDTFKPFYLPDGKLAKVAKTMARKVPGTEIKEHRDAGAEYQKIKLTVFNPGSRHHIANRLKFLYQWEPKEFTPDGKPKVDEDVLGALPWPEAKLLTEYFLVQKRLGLLIGKDQDKGWLNVCKDGRIYADMITNGAVTGRGTHQIIANVPKVGTPYGAEMRALFTATPGWKQVGADMSGIELRLLAHYMARYDDGAYGKLVCEGDVHTANQKAAGLPTRDNAKTFIYGWLYGAGDEKIGSITGKGRAEGKRLKNQFLKATPGLGKLIELVQAKASKGFLIGLDGRRLHIRKAHAALNTLLQSAGAILSKAWMVEVDEELTRRNWHNIAKQLIWYHDELQFDVVPEYAEEFGKLTIECLVRAAEKFGIRVPITGEYKIGNNWKECH